MLIFCNYRQLLHHMHEKYKSKHHQHLVHLVLIPSGREKEITVVPNPIKVIIQSQSPVLKFWINLSR